MEQLAPAEIAKRAKVARTARFARAERELHPAALKLANSAPAIYQDRLIKALLGLASPKVSIRAQCEQCVGWEDVRNRVGGCGSFGCALHKFRPYQK